MTLHLIATLWTLSVLVGSLLLLHGMIRQDWEKIIAALLMQPLRRYPLKPGENEGERQQHGYSPELYPQQKLTTLHRERPCRSRSAPTPAR